jgi:hypothetical protein
LDSLLNSPTNEYGVPEISPSQDADSAFIAIALRREAADIAAELEDIRHLLSRYVPTPLVPYVPAST